MSVLGYLDEGTVQEVTMDPEAARDIMAAVIARVNSEFGAAEILSPDAETEARIRERIRAVTQAVELQHDHRNVLYVQEAPAHHHREAEGLAI